jgi:hypothetical protein
MSKKANEANKLSSRIVVDELLSSARKKSFCVLFECGKYFLSS